MSAQAPAPHPHERVDSGPGSTDPELPAYKSIFEIIGKPKVTEDGWYVQDFSHFPGAPIARPQAGSAIGDSPSEGEAAPPVAPEPASDTASERGSSEPAAPRPKRPVTAAQARARAENGRKHATGPKTAEGKARSSQNAATHRGYSLTPVVQHGRLAEEPAVFEAFMEAFVGDLDVVGPVELEIGRNIAFLHWRLRRPQAYEAALLAQQEADEPSFEVSATRRKVARYIGALQVLTDPEGVYTEDEYVGALIECGHAIGLHMDDDYPKRRPRSAQGWNDLIDWTVGDAGSSRSAVISHVEESLAEDQAFLHEMTIREIEATAARVVQGDMLLKITRVEGHLGREITRQHKLLGEVQKRRLDAAED